MSEQELTAIRNPETGEVGHISTSILEENMKLLKMLGYEIVPTQPDGFRTRRKRPKGWMKQAVKDGVIADPDNPAPAATYGPDAVVFDVPVATATVAGKEPK